MQVKGSIWSDLSAEIYIITGKGEYN